MHLKTYDIKIKKIDYDQVISIISIVGRTAEIISATFR